SGGGGGAVKRKLKEHIDWLTKIRKQKLLQAAKGIENSYGTAMDKATVSQQLLSPRLQQLKSCDEGGSSDSSSHNHQQEHNVATGGGSTETPTTPRRRSSWALSSSSSPHESGDEAGGHRGGGGGTRTTPRSRRYSINGMRVTPESTSIRRFLTVTTPTSRSNAQASS
uniref:Uncharacterized protein n=1 Tax=Anopheles maculatus TaxID=74869 RepID=A0A182SQL5_9DIPT